MLSQGRIRYGNESRPVILNWRGIQSTSPSCSDYTRMELNNGGPIDYRPIGVVSSGMVVKELSYQGFKVKIHDLNFERLVICIRKENIKYNLTHY